VRGNGLTDLVAILGVAPVYKPWAVVDFHPNIFAAFLARSRRDVRLTAHDVGPSRLGASGPLP